MENQQVRKKVLLLIKTEVVLGGAERRLSRAFSRISRHDIEILIYVPNNKNEIFNHFRSFVPEEFDNLICTTSYFDVMKRIVNGKYDWISYCNESGSFLMIALISHLSRGKILWTIAYVDTAYLKFNNIKRKILFKIYILLAHRIDCLYPSSINKLRQISKNRVISQTPMPSTDQVLFKPGEKQQIIVFAARFENLKGWELFLQAIKLCKQELIHRDYRVLMCGSGSRNQEVLDTILHYGIESIVEVKGHIAMFEVLPYSKIFLSLQESENYPSQSLIEAISCGCWCIATDVGDTRKMVKSNFGELVESSSYKVAEAIIKSISMDFAQFSNACNAATKFAERNFSIDNAIDYFTEIFDAE